MAQFFQVYNVVSGKTVKTLMSEYRKRKQTHTMPTFVRQTRSRPRPQKKNSREMVDEVDKEIDAQQKKSIMKVQTDLMSFVESKMSHKVNIKKKRIKYLKLLNFVLFRTMMHISILGLR